MFLCFTPALRLKNSVFLTDAAYRQAFGSEMSAFVRRTDRKFIKRSMDLEPQFRAVRNGRFGQSQSYKLGVR